MRSFLALAFSAILAVSFAGAGFAQPYQATDALGRTLAFDREPQRIVVAGRATLLLADALYLFPGVGSRIVAIGETDQGLGDVLPLIDPDYQSKARFLNAAGPEQLAAAKPDLVVLKVYMKSSLGDALERIGIPVFYLDLESAEAFRRDILSIGDLLQEPDRAREVTRWYADRVSAVSRAVAGAPKPRVLVLQSSGLDAGASFSIPPSGWIQSWMVKTAGGEPLWLDANKGSGWSKVGLEQIVAWNPQETLVVSYRAPSTKAADQLRSMGSLKGAVHPFPADYLSWDQADARWILGLEWMAATLHPDLFPGFDLVSEVNAFYRDLYGMDPPRISEAILPRLARALAGP